MYAIEPYSYRLSRCHLPLFVCDKTLLCKFFTIETFSTMRWIKARISSAYIDTVHLNYFDCKRDCREMSKSLHIETYLHP
ncbi:hypothetical protein PUN28_008059 [Cardiocondyla obscurior]|uniref:Uncharacterized protein n=1 Tax=Cardiocondyla obscurior TaxID=286306 RepID=A0AAW2FY18_9HYME